MSEGTPFGRLDDPDAVESLRRSSADADHEAVHGEASAEAWSDVEADADDLSSSEDADEAAGFGPRSAGDQVDLDAEEADEITARLTSEP
jgi:hypothetical protein